ncbi:MAG: PaaI family thioesterase [Bacillota bacterium]
MKTYPHCFGCGADNPQGLQLKPGRTNDGSWESVFIPKESHCGWPGVVHGGILATALDEICGYVVFGEGLSAVTTGMSVSFKQAAAPGERLTVRARPVRVTRRLVDTAGEILRPDGSVVAACEARFLVLSENQRRTMGIPESGQ